MLFQFVIHNDSRLTQQFNCSAIKIILPCILLTFYSINLTLRQFVAFCCSILLLTYSISILLFIHLHDILFVVREHIVANVQERNGVTTTKVHDKIRTPIPFFVLFDQPNFHSIFHLPLRNHEQTEKLFTPTPTISQFLVKVKTTTLQKHYAQDVFVV